MRLRVVNCQQCGASAQLRDGATSTTCASCGSPILLDGILRSESRLARQHPNPTPLRVGMKAKFGGKEYELIGRVVFSTVEEGETYYWNEFQLLSADGDCFFLEYDEGQWKQMESFVPQTPIGPQEANGLRIGSSLSLDNTPCTVTHQGVSTIRFIQGELTYAAKVGDQRHYLDAKSVNRVYSVEWNEDEIEFYKGRFLSERQVLVAFDLRKQVAALDRAEKIRASRNLFAAACLLMAILAFLFWAVSLSGGATVSKGSVPIDSVSADGVRFGPITLNPGQRIHRLVIWGNMREASAWVAGVLETADGTELIGTQRDFWDESGYDDGYWHEWDLRAQTDFVVKQPGPYFIRLYTEKDPSRGTFQNVGYELKGGVLYPHYLMTFGIVALLVSVLFFCIANPQALKKMAEAASDDD